MFPAFHLLEREAFFNPRAAVPSVVLQGSCRVTDALPFERKERGSKDNEYAGHRFDCSGVSVGRLHASTAAGWQTNGASTPLQRPLLSSMRTAGTMFPPTAGPCLHTSSAPLQVQALSPVRSRPPLSAGCRSCCGCLIGGIFFGAVTDFGALYASVKNDGKSMGMLIEKYIGKTGRKLFLLFCWLFCGIVIAAFRRHGCRHLQCLRYRRCSGPRLLRPTVLPAWSPSCSWCSP